MLVLHMWAPACCSACQQSERLTAPDHTETGSNQLAARALGRLNLNSGVPPASKGAQVSLGSEPNNPCGTQFNSMQPGSGMRQQSGRPPASKGVKSPVSSEPNRGRPARMRCTSQSWLPMGTAPCATLFSQPSRYMHHSAIAAHYAACTSTLRNLFSQPLTCVTSYIICKARLSSLPGCTIPPSPGCSKCTALGSMPVFSAEIQPPLSQLPHSGLCMEGATSSSMQLDSAWAAAAHTAWQC